jgi:hypothetical protein
MPSGLHLRDPMDTDRKRLLRGSLASQLEMVFPAAGLDRLGRAKWLGEQLENYVERWLGFWTVSSRRTPPAADDLFGMIEVGAELMGEELAGAAATDVVASWSNFLAVLDGVRHEGDTQRPENLTQTLAALRAALADS